VDTIKKFNTTELDIIREIVSIAFVKSADSFAMMAHEKILISYADFQLTQPTKVFVNSNYEMNDELVNIISDLAGDLNGKTMLLFNKTDRKNVVKSCMGLEYSEDEEFKKIEEAFLLEFGNIITGSIVTQLSNIFNLNIHGKVPSIQKGMISNIRDTIAKEYDLVSPLILAVKTVFLIKDYELKPNLLLIFDETSIDRIQNIINTFDANKKDLF